MPPSPAPEDAASPRTSAALAATFRSLRHRNYRLYFFGQMVSLTGSWMQTTALLWLAHELTHTSAWPALVSAAQIVPAFLLGPWSGALADRVAKQPLILATQTAYALQALALAALVFAGVAGPVTLLLLALLAGLVSGLDLPARQAFVPELVGHEDLLNAVALNSLLFNVARAAGPLVGGYLLAWVGPAACFLANGLSYAAVLWALARMDVRGGPHPASAAAGASSPLAGFGYLARRPRAALLVILAGLMALLGWPAMSLLPALARSWLDVGERGYSLLVSGVGGGALAAALTVARFGSLARRQHFIGFGVGLAGLALFGLSFAPTALAAAGCCALLGYGLILFFTNCQTSVQLSAEAGNRGRIMGIWSMALSGGVPLGNLLAGPAADRWGELVVLRLQGAGCAAACAVLLVLGYRGRSRAGEEDRLTTAAGG